MILTSTCQKLMLSVTSTKYLLNVSYQFSALIKFNQYLTDPYLYIITFFIGFYKQRVYNKSYCETKLFCLTLRPRMPHICGILDCFSSSHVLATS